MEIPAEHRLTIEMLAAAFPDGISRNDLNPVVHLLYEEGMMSRRSVATALALYAERFPVESPSDTRRLPPGYDALYGAFYLLPGGEPPPEAEIERVRGRLIGHGWDHWLSRP